MPNYRKRLIILIILLSLVLGLGVFSYAYFSAQISGNETSSSVTLNGGKMNITFNDGNPNIVANNISPEKEAFATKTFTITGTNTTDTKMNYELFLIIDANTFTDNAISYTLDGVNTSLNGGLVSNINDTALVSGALTTRLGIGYFDGNSTNKTHTYTLKIFFKETENDQNIDQNKMFKAHVSLDGRNIKSLTLSGTNNSLTNTQGKNIIDYKIYGKSLQNGTPTIETPISVQSLGDAGNINVVTKGKNLFDSKSAIITNGTFQDEIWSFKDKLYDRILSMKYFKPNLNTNYTIVLDIVENTMNSTMRLISDARFYFENYTLTIPLNKTGRFIINTKSRTDFTNVTLGSLWFQTTNTVVGTFKCKIMIMEGTYALNDIGNYEPYQEGKTHSINLSDPLRCIGDVCDYIDYEKQKIVRNVGKLVLDSSSNVTYNLTYSNDDYKIYMFNFKNNFGFNYGNIDSVSTHFSKIASVWSSHGKDKYTLQDANTNGRAIFWMSVDTIKAPTLVDFKNIIVREYNNNTPITLYYVLKDQIMEDISLPEIKILNGTTLIEASDEILNSSKLEITY